jgi:Cu/Zn superoxide dismutase
MSWGYYSGKLTDFSDTDGETFKGASASAFMMGLDGRSFFRLRVSGIKADEGVYGVHLHQKACTDKSGDVGPHYNVTWNSTTNAGDIVSNKTEVWLDLEVDSDGDARSSATVDFIPKGERSIVLHAEFTKPNGTAGTKLACLPFNIKTYPN